MALPPPAIATEAADAASAPPVPWGRLQLLGLPRAEWGGSTLRFPDRKCVALLAVLALDGPSTRARLATLLWDGQNDADARRNLRRELHRLRGAGFDALLASDGDTLQLQPHVDLDTTAFMAATDTTAGTAAGTLPPPAADAQTLPAPEALALYGAGLLAGFDLAGAPSFNDWLAARRDALAQRWRALAESHCAALQAQGDLRSALRLARELLQHDTLQEAHYRRVMALHAALGEREEALTAYQRCRRLLGRELGLKPLDETVALADAIRAGRGAAAAHFAASAVETPAPAVAPAAPSPAALLPAEPATSTRVRAPVPALQTLPAPPLVGRAPLLAALQSVLASPGFAVLRGEAGMGKSSLLRALVAATPGACLHAARSSDRRVPFAALVRWLRAAAPLQGLPAWVCTELARLLPEYGTPPPPISTDAERLRLFEAVRVAWAAAFGGNRLQVFDDWQWIDGASAGWWAWWLGASDRAAVLVAGRPGGAGSRSANRRDGFTGADGLAGTDSAALHEGAESTALLEGTESAALLEGTESAALLAEALAAASGRVLDLPPLDGTAMFELVQALSGTANPRRFAQRLWRATGGHPLYALETLQHLLQTEMITIDAHGQWVTPFDDATADYGELPIAPSVQAAVMQRVNRLAEAPRRLAEAASLAGDDFSLPLLAAASALGEWDAVQALEAALQARVLERVPAQAPTRPVHALGAVAHAAPPNTLYRFVHDLFAQTVAGALSPERRRLLHHSIGQRLAQEGAAPARVAEHLEQGAQSAGDSAEACAWRLRAMAAARQRMALADMLLQADRVLALAPPREAAVRAHLARSAALVAQSQGEAAAQALAAARALLLPGTDVGLHVDVLSTQAFHTLQGGGNEAMLAALDGLLQDNRLSSHQRGRLLKRRSDTLRTLNRPAEADQALTAALAAFGDEPSMELGNAHDSRARIAMSQGDFATTLQEARHAVAVMRALGETAALAAPLTLCGVALLCQGQTEAALAELQPARALAHQHGLVSAERSAILNLVPALLALGRTEEALKSLEEGYALSPTFRGPAEQQAFLEARYQCRVDSGDLGAAWALRPELLAFSARLEEHSRRHSGLLVAVDLPLLLGDTAAAAEALNPVLADLRPETPSFLAVQALAKGCWMALQAGQPALALQRSTAALALPCQRPEDEALRSAFHAAALLAQAQPAAARQALHEPQQGVGTEVLALFRATALQVQQASGGVEPALQAAALQQLHSGAVPPLVALHLIDALVAGDGEGSGCNSGTDNRTRGDSDGRMNEGARTGTSDSTSQATTPGPLPAQARSLARQLHTSLGAHPEAQACFAQRHARWLAAAPLA